MPETERDAGRPGIPDDDDRIAVLVSALRACLTRLDDLGEGDGPTAKAARDALRRAGL